MPVGRAWNSADACPWAGTASDCPCKTTRWVRPSPEITVSWTRKCAGTVIVGGVTVPPGLIVKVAGTRALTAPVPAVWVRVTVVSVAVVRLVVVSGVMVDDVVGVGEDAVGVDEDVVDFPPPQPATNRAAKRTASVLTFAG